MRLLRFPRQVSSNREPRRQGRWRRWVLRVLAGLVGLITVAVVAAVLFGRSLDQRWVKRWIQELARTVVGVDVDYRTARLDLLSGVDIEKLVVRSPSEFRSFAPELVRIERVAARWSPRSLFARRPVIGRVIASRVTLTAVVDEHGRTSLDALVAPSTSPPKPALPLSRRASSLLGTATSIEALDVDHITLSLIRTDHGKVSDRTELEDLAASVTVTSQTPRADGVRAVLKLGSPSNLLELGLTRTREGVSLGRARAKLWGEVIATPSVLTAALDLRMLEQTFAANVSADHSLHAEATARFDPIARRTEVVLDHTVAGDGAATAQATVVIPDDGRPVVQSARGDIDLARLLRWLPAGLIPVTVDRARVQYRIESLVVGPVVQLAAGGEAAVDVDVSNATWSSAAGPVRTDGVQLALRALPSQAGAVAVQGSMKLSRAELATPKARFVADDVAIAVDGHQGAGGAVAGRVGVRFARVERGGAAPLVARDGKVELRADGLRADATKPLTARGDLTVSTELASFDARVAGARAMLDGLSLRGHTALTGQAPFVADLGLDAARLRVIRGDGNLVADAPLHVAGKVHDVRPDVVHPMASRGVLRLAAAMGETQVSLDATKRADAVDYALRAASSSLKVVRPFLPPGLNDVAPWDRMAIAVRSRGRVEHFGGAPSLVETTQIDVERPAFEDLAASSVSLQLESQGSSVRQRFDVDLRARDLAVDGGRPKDDHATLSAIVNAGAPSLQFELAAEGHGATKLSGSASFDSSRRAIVYAVDGRLAHLEELAPLTAKVRGLDAFDLSELEIGLSARGALLGVLDGVLPDGTVKLEPSPARTAAVEGKAELRLAHFRWAKGDVAIATPAVTWQGDLHAEGARRTLDSRLAIGTLHVDVGSRDVDVNGVDDTASAVVTGNLLDPEIELEQRLSIRAVEQSVVPEYPLGQVAMTLSVEHNPEDGSDALMHISDLKVENGLGGTTLAAAGNVALGSRRTLSVTTSLTQDLERLSTMPERFKGRGKVAVEANVTSPDLKRYRVLAAMKGDDVTVVLPRAGIDVERANGDVPVTLAFEVSEHGVVVPGVGARSPYSMLRFSDQHPLLNRSGFLSIVRLKTPFVSIAPLVGNLAIEQNVVALRQFEMGVHNGTVTGQCGIDWNGMKSTVDLHVRAVGVQSSHGEPFDGNIAVAISAADRTIDGRAEILRIGKHHLLDLLDMEDPLHVDRAMNRLRDELAFGYPDTVKLVFDHGFASARVALGGIASLFSVGELRGIPMGPIVDRMLASMLAQSDTKEMP
ncbi:MAG TPA: hypothetical protein VHC69_09810 [Polyangiaceae bacterium]|nr:hypothetical protein [Polyangiaceae bacterium]